MTPPQTAGPFAEEPGRTTWHLAPKDGLYSTYIRSKSQRLQWQPSCLAFQLQWGPVPEELVGFSHHLPLLLEGKKLPKTNSLYPCQGFGFANIYQISNVQAFQVWRRPFFSQPRTAQSSLGHLWCDEVAAVPFAHRLGETNCFSSRFEPHSWFGSFKFVVGVGSERTFIYLWCEMVWDCMSCTTWCCDSAELLKLFIVVLVVAVAP